MKRSTSELYERHFEFVWTNLRRLGVPEDQLEDAVHDVFVVVHRRRASYDGSAQVRTWLFGILRRVASHHRRGLVRHRRRLDALAAEPPPQLATEEALEHRRRLRVAEACLARLEPRKREVFILVHVEQMTGREAADALAINPNTASARLRAARQAFEAGLRSVAPAPAPDVTAAALREADEAPPAAKRRVMAALTPVFALGGTSGAPRSGGPTPMVSPVVRGEVVGAAVSPSTLALAATVLTAALGGRAAASYRSGPAAAAVAVTPGAAAEAPRRDAVAQRRPPKERSAGARPPQVLPRRPVAPDGGTARDTPKAPPAPAAAPTPDVAPAPEPTPAQARQRRPRKARTDDDAAGSTMAAQNEHARRVFQSTDPKATIDLVSAYERDYPNGFFAQPLAERAVKALCQLGRTKQARARASALRRRFPGTRVTATPCGSGAGAQDPSPHEITKSKAPGHSPSR